MSVHDRTPNEITRANAGGRSRFRFSIVMGRPHRSVPAFAKIQVKLFNRIVCLMLLAGCAHQNGSFAQLPLNGPISREAAITIATKEVRAREKWKLIDYDAESRGDGWKVWVCPKPVKLIGPVAIVTIDDKGRLSSYEKFFNNK